MYPKCIRKKGAEKLLKWTKSYQKRTEKWPKSIQKIFQMYPICIRNVSNWIQKPRFSRQYDRLSLSRVSSSKSSWPPPNDEVRIGGLGLDDLDEAKNGGQKLGCSQLLSTFCLPTQTRKTSIEMQQSKSNSQQRDNNTKKKGNKARFVKKNGLFLSEKYRIIFKNPRASEW